MSFFGKVIGNLLNQHLTEALSRSPTFQRAARSSVENVRFMQNVLKGEEKLEIRVPKIDAAPAQKPKPAGPPTTFFGHLKNEIMKDVSSLK